MNVHTYTTIRNSLSCFTIVTGLVLLSPADLRADQVFADDLIVQNSACVGMDCIDGEVFSFDTIRLKENNLRIKFDDTSTSASFPYVDWQITINDSASGGANKYSIDDITNAKTPFTIEANAPNHSLYVDDGGKLGLGTSTPVLDIHVTAGNTPALRLEQDNSQGWGAYVWDIAGNETNFFIRDVTGGSTLPFRIYPGAPSDALDIKADGKIGMGTSSPAASLHIKDNNAAVVGRTLLKLSNNGNTKIEMTDENAANTWSLIGGGNFNIKNNAGDKVLVLAPDGVLTLSNRGNSKIAMTDTTAATSWWLTSGVNFNIKNTNDTKVFVLAPNGTLTLTGELITAGGTCGGGCDKVFSSDFTVETVEDHAEKMWENSYLPAVGPTVENAPINLSQKTAGMLNELEKAHIYIAQLNTRLKEQEARMNELLSRLEQLDKPQ